MKSRVLALKKAVGRFAGFLKTLDGDHVALSAAQTSFFLITSAVPFLSLLITLSGLLLPEAPSTLTLTLPFADDFADLLRFIAEGIQSAPSVPLLSLTAVTTLWSASRGVSAIRSGLGTVYAAELSSNILTHRLKSLLSTLILLAAIPTASVLFIFGDRLSALFGDSFSGVGKWFGTPLFILSLTVAFTLIYYSVGRRSRVLNKSLLIHLPGALFSAAGWLVFSLFYSLYLRYFPRASTIYGGLAAVCLIMLWLYFCMMIFFLGAELNKHLFLYLEEKKAAAPGDDGAP